MSIGDNLSPIKTLDKDTVWQLLEKHPFGRLAVEAAGLVDIFPVNYVVDGEEVVGVFGGFGGLVDDDCGADEAVEGDAGDVLAVAACDPVDWGVEVCADVLADG